MAPTRPFGDRFDQLPETATLNRWRPNQAASAWVAYVVCAVPAWISLQPLLGAPHELSDECLGSPKRRS